MKDSKLVIILLAVLAVVAVGVVLSMLRSVLLPFAGAVLLSYLFRPLVLWFDRKGIHTSVALVVVLLIVSTLLAGLGGILYSTIESFNNELPVYSERIQGIANDAVGWFSVQAAQWDIDITDYFSPAIFSFGAITQAVQTGLSSFLVVFSNGLLVMLFLMFILAGSGNFAPKFASAFTSDQAARVSGIVGNIDEQIKQYLLTKTLVSLVTGFLTAVILLIIGVDFPFLWGFLTFLLNFIPTFGSIIATIFPVVISMLQFESLITPVIVLVLLISTQFAIGNIVEPRLMAVSLNLSPLVIFFSIILWAWLWGPWGMVMAVPMTAAIKIICENVTALQPIAIMMSGPPEDG